ncbi:MAG TPA: hypothetical protein VFM34_12840 [Moraxellaceae bacterium]|nr:hypothetical protein [Moraxellaceae bacterium]
MSHSTIPSANKAASALFRLASTLTLVLACMFFAVHFGDRLHGGTALLYGVGGAGALLILRRLVILFRELASPLPRPEARHPIKY